ncbi:ATP-binding protein [Microlunatus parietis]
MAKEPMSATEPRSMPGPGASDADRPGNGRPLPSDVAETVQAGEAGEVGEVEQPAPTTADQAAAPVPPTPPPLPSTVPPKPAAVPQPEPEERPRATRLAGTAMLGGVCAGLARHLGWPVMVLRVGFIVLMCIQFVGVVIYGLLWLLLPPEPIRAAPGLESASRSGMRDSAGQIRRFDWGAMFALVALGVGLLWMIQISGLGMAQQIFWPVLFACAGVALVWRQADVSRQRQALAELAARPRTARSVARDRSLTTVSLILGLALVGVAFALVLVQQGNFEQLPNVLAMTMLALAALAIVLAPWLHKSRAELNEARAEKVRAETRADMAAHLHDSVLQTLALIQRQADDPKIVQRLARRQERELRGWLYDDETEQVTFKAALAAAAADVEDDRGTPIEVVTVGDSHPSEAVQAIVAAAREAMVNAAKHSGADKIDVYAEVFGDELEVFVRDRGQGFDPAGMGADRMGVRRSIIDRMERHGGSAEIRSEPGDGTEVRLKIDNH